MSRMTLSTLDVKKPATNPRHSATMALQVALDRIQAGRELAQLREQNRLTQEALKDASGLSLSTVQRYERGASVPRFHNLDALAGVLGTKVYDIFRESAPEGERPATTPDPFPNGSHDQLDRIEADIAEILALLRSPAVRPSQRVADEIEQTVARQAARRAADAPERTSTSTRKRQAER